MHIPWADVQLFLAIAEAGSLSRAATRLQVTQPTVSRRLAELEAALGEPLFARRVDGTTLTSYGERLLAPVRRMAEHAGEVERIAAGAEASPRGVVRLTAPPGVAFGFVAPLAAHLRARLPEVQLEVLSTIRYLDLVRGEADLGIRLRPLARAGGQRDLVTLASLDQRLAGFATRAYVRTLPRGFTIADVAWIGWPAALDQLPPNPQLAARVPGFRPVFASDDFLVQLRGAEAGVGAIILGRFEHRFALPTPLVELDLDLGPFRSTLELVCARTALAIPRVKAVADLLATELGRVRTGRRPGGRSRPAVSL